MKRLLPFLFSACIIAIISAFSISDTSEIQESKNYEIPENVNTILDQSCIMCHNKDSKNTKSKAKLKLDELDDLSKSKMISKLSKIAKEVNKGDMPPEKFTSKYPEKALSEEDKSTLIAWAKNYAQELSK